MKKIVSILLAVLICLSTFALAQGDGTQLPTSVVTEIGPERIVDEPVTISLWTAGQTENIDDYENALMVRWYEEKTGVHVDFRVQPADAGQDRLNTTIASKDYPDIFNTYLSVDTVNQYGGPDGIFMAIDDLIEEGWMPNLEKWLNSHPDLDTMRSHDGKLYAIPAVSSAPWMIYVKKMYVKTAWLDQYLNDGNDFPETYLEFEDMLRYFQENDMNGDGDTEDEIPMIGLQPSGWGTDPTNTLLSYFGPSLGQGNSQFLFVDENGDTQWSGSMPWYRDALRWIHSLLVDGLYDKSTYTMSQGTYRSLVADDLVGVAAGATPGQFTDAALEADWTALPPMEGPYGYRGVPVNSLEYDNMSFSTAFSKTCSNPEVCAKWMDYFFSDEGAIMASFGIKDINYYISDTKSIAGDPTSIVSIKGENEVYNSWWGNQVSGSPDCSLRYSAEEGNNALYVEHARVYEPYYVYTGIPMIGVTLSDAEEARLAECFNHVCLQTYYYSFDYITGVRNVESDSSWEKFCAYINTDNMLDDYIRLVNKKYRGIEE